jgi:chondroitin 4-sulfotransferase 11
MINHTHRCLFVHIPKTAGKSVKRFFGTEWQPHQDLARYAQQLPAEVFSTYWKFAVVRNPWDRLLSDYNFQLKKSAPDSDRLFLHHPGGGVRSFREWLTAVLADPFHYPASAWGGSVSPGIHRWSPQVDWISLQGKIAVDQVLRIENLAADFPSLCRRLNVPPAELPCRNWQFHFHYADYYDPESRDLVARHFARDIEAFGYRFEVRNNRLGWVMAEKIRPRVKSVWRSITAALRPHPAG